MRVGTCFPGVVSVLLLSATVTAAGAQSFQGGVRGAVKDANGVIPGVEVSLTNEGTNVSRSTVSNSVGEYAFASVLPGVYTIKAVLQGFKTFERRRLTVATQAFLTIDIAMEVGTIQEAVTVTAEAPLIETSNASIGAVLDKATLAALPSLTRNAFMSAVTLPTVIASANPFSSRMQDQSSGSAVSLGGGLRGTNNYLLDGVPITDMTNRPALFPTVESLDDINVQVHTYDAEMGRTGGGVFNTTGRSGTNEMHGVGLAQYRPTWGAANTFFNERAGIPKQEGLYWRLYAGSLGGPIVRNRTFFFVATEGYRSLEPRDGQLIFPTDLERRGDFSQTFDRNGQLVVIYDPLTTRTVNGATVRDPFPGNVIPANRISRVAANVANLFPQTQVQRSGANGVANFVKSANTVNLADMVTSKVEHKFTDDWSLTGMYIYSRTNEPHAVFFEDHKEFDPNANVFKRRPKVLAVNNIWIPSSTTVVALRYGWMSFPDPQVPPSGGFDIGSLGFPASYVNAVTGQKFPAFNIANVGEIGVAQSIGDGGFVNVHHKSWGLNGSVSKLMGRHTVKFGADFRNIARGDTSLGQATGTFQFDQEWTQANPTAAAVSNQGAGFASFLLGLPSANPARPSSVPVNTPLEFFVRYYGGYVQDDWRVNSNLTVNYGIRYEWEPGLGEVENRFLAAFDRTAVSPLAAATGLDLRGGLRYAGQDGFPTTQGDPSKRKVSPRAGVVWSMNDKTVLRGGYGLFWAPFTYSTFAALGYNQLTFTDQSNQLIPTASLDNPFPNGLLQPTGNSQGLLTGVGGGNVNFNNQDRRSPYLQQYSLDLQRELPWNMAASIGYVGTRGENLNYGTININQLRPEVVAEWGSRLNDRLPNPFFGIPAAGAFATQATLTRGQLLRPFPQFGNVLQDQTTGAVTRYNAVILRLDKRMSSGWGGRFHYTWSELNSSQFSETNFYASGRQSAPLNSYNPAAEYSRSLLDQPHRVVLSPIVQLPFGEGRKWANSGLADRLVGGWTLSMIATYDAGYPVNITQSSDNTGSFGGVQRPNWTGTDPTTDGDTIDRLTGYINPAAYTAAPAFTFGSGARTDARNRTPFRSNYDVVFAKDTALFSGVKAQIRVEMLNITNSTKFVGPETRVGNPAFGTITTQAGFSRLTQLTFRLFW